MVESREAGLLVDHPASGVVRLRIHRPESRNALSVAVREALVSELSIAEADAEIRCIIIAGGDRVFAAGADIRELADVGSTDMMLRATERLWGAIAQCRTPIVEAVRGIAFGGGWDPGRHADKD